MKRTRTGRLALLGLLAFVLAALPGCDSDDGDDGPSEVGVFAGSWTLTGLTDNGVDRTDVFAETISAFNVTFSAADGDDQGTFELDATGADGTLLAALDGFYSVDEGEGRLRLDTEFNTLPLLFQFDYDIEDNDTVRLTDANGQFAFALNTLGGSAFEGPLQVTLSRL